MIKHYITIAALACILLLHACDTDRTVKTVVDRASFAQRDITVEEVPPINDKAIERDFLQKAGEYHRTHGSTSRDSLQKQLRRKKCSIPPFKGNVSVQHGVNFYDHFKKSVLIAGRLFKHKDYSDYLLGTASAFVVSEDGICVSNYHIFKSFNPSKPVNYDGYFVQDYEGTIYPVVEILAASKQDDISVFRIKTDGAKLYPLAIGNETGTGEPIHVISHPDKRFYSYTQGYVTRKYIKPGMTITRQSISAEFALGSSGAPVLNAQGQLTGIVAGTQNIYYVSKWQGYQATIKEIIPVSRLKALLE